MAAQVEWQSKASTTGTVAAAVTAVERDIGTSVTGGTSVVADFAVSTRRPVLAAEQRVPAEVSARSVASAP